MNGGRGAKGSINDRLISLMYKNRYKKLQLQKDSYNKGSKQAERKFLKSIEDFDIDDGALHLEEKERAVIVDVLNPLNDEMLVEDQNLNDKYSNMVNLTVHDDSNIVELHSISEKMVEYDPKNEEFDFDKFDYYELIEKKSGIGSHSKDEIIDVDREIKKVDDEIVIVEELEKFIDDGLELIAEIKKDLDFIKSRVQEQYTESQILELEESFKRVREKANILKKQYDVVSEKYNFDNFSILNNIEMVLAIDDYKDKASLEELETLVDYCKDEINQIDGIIIETEKSVGIEEDISDKKTDIKRRDEDFKENKTGVIYLDNLEIKIAKEAREQRRIIIELEKKLGDFQVDIVPVMRTVFHTERLFGSFLRIAAGILTSPFSGRRVFGTMLGLNLINRGIRGVRESLTPEYVTENETVVRYKSIEREILNSKDYVNTTDLLITDSLSQLNKFDEEFKYKFKPYSGLIPEYSQVEKQIEELKTSLKQKQLEINIMKNDLNRQYEANKVKVRKAS